MHSPYITTSLGLRFYFLEPERSRISSRDIAYSLAHTYRWNGHLPSPVSVAQHSLAVAEEAMALARADGASKALMQAVWFRAITHDAAEAYTGDIPTPFKRMLRIWEPPVKPGSIWSWIGRTWRNYVCPRTVEQYEAQILKRIRRGISIGFEKAFSEPRIAALADTYVERADKAALRWEAESIVFASDEPWWQALPTLTSTAAVTIMVAARHPLEWARLMESVMYGISVEKTP